MVAAKGSARIDSPFAKRMLGARARRRDASGGCPGQRGRTKPPLAGSRTRTPFDIALNPCKRAPNPRRWLLTAVIIASGILAALATTACRGGGANPGEDDLVIPSSNPPCRNEPASTKSTPPTAPRFERYPTPTSNPDRTELTTQSSNQGEGESPGASIGKSKSTTPAGSKTAACSEPPTATERAPPDSSWPTSSPVGDNRWNRHEHRRAYDASEYPPDQGYGEAGSPTAHTRKRNALLRRRTRLE